MFTLIAFRKALEMPYRMVAPPRHRDRVRLFGNPFLESLTFVSAPAFIALWAAALPAIAMVGIKTAPTAWSILMFTGGLVIWTLTEYLLHRFVFHFEARSGWLQNVIFIIHGNHHAVPNDPLRNLMPPIVSVPVCALVWAMCVWLAGPSGTWYLFGFVLGYVVYDLLHYACHQWPMKGRIAQMLKVHHMRHHHLQVAGNFAITGALWDRIFATRITSLSKKN